MYIKLTRLDGSPIWINASYIVTIEPRRGGGSVVVPIGDGLDYDVRESPEKVLGCLAEIPVRPIVPVPAPKSLTKMPDDVSPEPVSPAEREREEASEKAATPTASDAAEEKPSRKTRKTTAKKTARKPKKAAEEAEEASPVQETPADAPSETPSPETPAPAEASDAAGPPSPPSEPPAEAPVAPVATSADENPAPAPAPAASRLDDLTEDQISKIVRMAPGTLKKLKNTLLTQFRVADPDVAVQQLVSRGLLSLTRDHVDWLT